MGKLLIQIGLPRAGKSTKSKYWVCDNTGEKKVVVSGDKIRLALGCRYNSHTEEWVKTIEHTMIKSLLLDGYSVMVDDCNTTWNQIKPLLQLDPDAEFRWVPEVSPKINPMSYFNTNSPEFTAHVNECIKRAYNTGQPDLESVIHRYASNLHFLQQDWDKNLLLERQNARWYSPVIRVK